MQSIQLASHLSFSSLFVLAGLCSANGRHLAMMPHPERCFLTWQLPYHPKDLGLDPYGPAPWIKLFQNAREWAESHAAGSDEEEF